MIISLDMLEKFVKDGEKLAVTSGGFDPLHMGHVRCINGTADIAKNNNCKTVVVVNGDGFLARKKGKPFMSHQERMSIIDSLKGVDYVVGWDDGTQTVIGFIDRFRPLFFAKGGDRSTPEAVPENEVCSKVGCTIVFGVGGIDKVQSSSNLIKNCKDDVDITQKKSEDIIRGEYIDKPWGYESIFVKSDKYVGKIISISPNCRLSRQYHEFKDETIYVLSGTLLLEIGLEDREHIFLTPGESYRITPGIVHRFVSWFGQTKLLEISTPELNDVIRLEDDYNR